MAGDSADPTGVVAATQTGAAPLTVFAAPATGSEFNTLGERLVPKACFKVEDLLFDFGSSFILPELKNHLPKLAQLRNDNKAADPATGASIFPPLSIFGHADPVGDDDLNKVLSGRRATAFYAMLVRDADLWEGLFAAPFKNDDWGARSIQTMLSTVQAPIGIDGKAGEETRTAIRTFQQTNGLGVDGVAGPATRKALYRAYMEALCGPDLKLDKTRDFLAHNKDGAGGKGDFQGCSEFNPLRVFSAKETAAFAAKADHTERNQENAINRRVVALLFAPGRRVNPAAWPCPRVKEGVADCKKRFFPDAVTRRNPQGARREFEDTKDTFACRFYQIITDDSPCERVKPAPPPPPVVLGVNPLILFALADSTVTAAGAATSQSFVSAVAPAVGAVTPLKDIVLVKKPYTNPTRVEVVLKTDVAFDGDGVLTVSDANSILLFPTRNSNTPLQFNGTDNRFKGAQLNPAGAGVSLFAEGKTASPSMGAFVLTLRLSGGTKKPGPDAVAKMTAIELILDICAPRVNATTAPAPLPQAPAVKAATPNDKFFLGRPIPIQDAAKIQERAMLIVQPVKTTGFAALNKRLVLVRIGGNATTFAQETPPTSSADVVIPSRHTFLSTSTATNFFVEGTSASANARDNSYQLGIDGLEGDGDRVSVTVVHAEIVSNKKPVDVRTVAIVPEKPARATRSTFFPAPIIVGRDFPIELRPFVLLARPSAFAWTRPDGVNVSMTDADKQVLKLTATSLSAKLDDTLIQVRVTSDVGQFLRRHRFTVVHVTIDSVLNGENIAASGPVNTIRNPAGLIILTGADAADAAKLAKIEMLRFPARATPTTIVAPILGIEPNLTWTDDDDRISWWIVGDDGGEYKGKADFRNAEAAKRGTKIEVFGSAEGDVLIQPYSGGFGYGMFRANVVTLRKIKYRVNRILTDEVPARRGRRRIPAREPTQSHAQAKDHIKVANIYLRQAGIELIPDDSVEVASRAGNPLIGLRSLDPRVVSVTRESNGHFDVKVNDQSMTFGASIPSDSLRAVRVNARNEVIVFAYVRSIVGVDALAVTVANPLNHAPNARRVPPPPSARFLRDKGVPSSSLIPRTGIPPDVPVREVRMVILDQQAVNFRGTSSATRDVNLQWGIVVPTTSIDANITRANQGIVPPPVSSDLAYGGTLAHELGHVLGLGHRGRRSDPITDNLAVPRFDNVMSGNTDFLRNENLDIIQVKAFRFSEVFFHNP